MDLGNTLEFSLPISTAGWYQIVTTGVSYGLVTNDKTGHINHTGMLLLYDGGSGVLATAFNDNTSCSPTGRRTKLGTTILVANQWYHIVSRQRGATDQDILIDEIDDGGTYSGTGGTIAYSTDLGAIGKVGDCPFVGNNLLINGQIAYVSFATSSLVAWEVNESRFDPLGVPNNNLVSMWSLLGATLTEVDLSGRGVNATNVNTQESNDGPPIFHRGLVQ
jgi:hypothetical protein